MCTLTILRQDKGFLITMNRDDAISRAPEEAPRWQPVGEAEPSFFAPVDTQAGGTWIGTNTRKFWACLLNGYADTDGEHHSSDPDKSRGHIIPALLRAKDPIQWIQHQSFEGYRSFHVVMGDAHQVYHWSWDDEELKAHSVNWLVSAGYEMLFFTSSSWQQSRVREHRKRDALKWLSDQKYTPEGIPSCHFNQEPKTRASDILVRRDAVCTRSISQMVIADHHPMQFKYMVDPLTPDAVAGVINLD